MSKNNKVIILCGGKGTRLREETGRVPKPLVPIGGIPILWHIMKSYDYHGYRDFVLCLGYLGNRIKEYFLHYDEMNSDLRIKTKPKKIDIIRPHEEAWTVSLIDTGLETQTAERLMRVHQPEFGPWSGSTMVTYGDGVADIDINALMEFHKKQGKLGTVTGVRPASRFGELQLDGDMVTAFREKPQIEEGWINGGFFVFEPEFFTKYLQAGVMLEREPLERLAADGELAIYRHNGYWRCMDTYRDMQALNNQWANGAAPWKVWE